MAWFALDDGFDTHPKVRKAGNAAVGLFVRLGVHATKHLTEGHLDGDIVRAYGTAPTIRKLIAVGMLHEPGHGCSRCPQPADGDYLIHDYLDYNKSRAQIEAAREAARKRQQRGRESARRNANPRGIDDVSRSNRSRNDADSDANRLRNDPLFEEEPAGQGGSSRRDTHEGATGVPSPPLPSHTTGADVVGGATGSRSRAEQQPDGCPAPAPIDDDGFTVTDPMRRWAASTVPGLDVDYETAQFVTHFRGERTRRRSWPDEWQKWMRRSAKFASERALRPASNVIALPGQPLTGTDAKVAGWLALSEQLRQNGDPA
ncbi:MULTISPECIES: hypothetical protein [unclassified Streptomyces]|uniref:hypothetical protein n=1 Tax=unclassified Streptomyces TaxID=2593676 RepID=UPI00081E548E|nr:MULTISPECIES: hypothetical protein [unclassified Streptomyces]MYR30574.1 hypothetical protein [Streptomyces sp. SID4945]SCF50153.1 hypothetical protein GA0115257_124113 [Streptomyces sp. LcepLS]